jgi:metal-responsive CopG/Arc/MetJ family transcriptional regulator
MKTKFVRINITIPEENLKDIDKFCNDESITRSEFIRESSLDFLSYKVQEREREKIRKDRKKAIEIADKFRKSSSLKNGTGIIRRFRDERNK